MSITLRPIEYIESSEEEEEENITAAYLNITADIEKEIKLIENKEKVFRKLCLLYYILDRFFLVVNFSVLIFSILISESNISLVLSIYTLSFSIVFDNKKYITILENLIVLYQDEIIPKIKRYIRIHYESSNRDIISQIQFIERRNLKKYLGINFSTPKRLRSLDWKKIILIFSCYIISFISLACICYLKSIEKLFF